MKDIELRNLQENIANEAIEKATYYRTVYDCFIQAGFEPWQAWNLIQIEFSIDHSIPVEIDENS